MDKQELYELMDRFAQSTLQVMKLRDGGFSLELRKPEPAPFVQVGGRVDKGATLCLIEAMKTMSEVPAPCDLIVEALLAEDGELVGFDAPLVRYRHV